MKCLRYFSLVLLLLNAINATAYFSATSPIIGGKSTMNEIDLELNYTANPTEYTVFTNNDFTLTITNSGATDATGVTIYAPFASNLAYTSSTASQGTYSVWSSIWDIGTLASGQSATLDLSLFILNTTADITLFAQVQAANESDIDSTPNNNNTQTPIEDDEASVTITHSSGGSGGGDDDDDDDDDNDDNDEVDIELSISTNHTEVNAGSQFSYLLSVTNKGPDNATGVKVDFPLPTHMVEFVSSSNDQTTYNNVTGQWNIGNLNKNVTRSLLVNVEVLVGGNISASAEVVAANQDDIDSTPDNGNTSEDDYGSVDVLGLQIDLELFLELADGQSSIVPVGSNVTYVLHVENKGPTVGYNTKIRAILPSNVFNYVSSTVSMGYFMSDLGVWVIGDIPAFETQTMEITATVTQSGTHTYTCEARTSNVPDVDSTPSNYDPNEDDISSVTISTDGTADVADLSLSAAIDNASANSGDTRTITLTVSNDGPADATGITIEDVMPTGLILFSSNASMGSYSAGIWTVGDLDNGEFATLDLEVIVGTLTEPVTYFAQIETASPNDTDATAGNDTDQTPDEDDEAAVTITQPTIDLELSVSSSVSSANIGDAATLTLTVSNIGGADATGVTVEDVFPSELQFDSSNATQGSYTGGVWTIGDLDSGETATLDIEVTIGDFTDSIDYFAQIETASPNNDPDSTPGNDTDQTANEDDEDGITITQPTVDMELSIEIFEHGDPHIKDIHLTLQNTGAANATEVVVEDVFPLNVILSGQATSKGTYENGVWTIGEVNSGEIHTLHLTTSVMNLTENVWYFAQVMTANPNNDTDSTPGNDSNQTADEDDEVSIMLTPTPVDLELSIASNISVADAGDNATLTLILTNNGFANATDVTVEDVMPAEFSLNSSNTADGSYSDGAWTVGTVMSGSSVTLTLEVTIDEIVSDITYFAQVETASPDDSDSTPGNNSNQTPSEDDEASVTIAPTVASTDIDLELDINCDVSEFNLFENITYTITVTNNGPATATGIEIANTLPSGLAFTSKTESQGNFNFWGGVWTVGTLNSGATATLDIVLFTLNNSAAISNFAQVKAANENDSDSTPNNSSGVATEDDEDSVTIVPAGSNNNDIDLALSKTSNVSIAEEGDAVSFTITVVNNGTVAATGVTVEDVLPNSLDFTSASATIGSYDETTGIWDIGTVAIGGNATLTINTTVNTIVLPITNFAQVKTANEDDVDSTPGNNSGNTPQEDDEDAITIQPDTSSNFVDLELTKTVNISTASAGDQVTYTITVTNNGPADATGITVADELPSELSFDNANASKGTYSSGSGTWSIGNLAENETVTLTIDATVNSITSAITNFAQVMTASPDDLDSTPGNDSNQAPDEDDEDSATIIPEGSTDIDLEATMTSNSVSVSPWTNVDFTLEVTNNGAAAASGVMIDFPIPEDMAFTSKIESQGSYNLWFQTWDVGVLQSGETATLSLTLFTLNPGTDVIAYAEVIAANETDIDSTPSNGNGSSAVEDDEAAFTLSNGSSGGKGDLESNIVGESSLLTVNRMYPVPTRDFVNVIFTSQAETIDVVLYDYSGRILHSHTLEVAQGENTTQIDLSAYPAGWYFVSMETEEGSVRAKVVKQ